MFLGGELRRSLSLGGVSYKVKCESRDHVLSVKILHSDGKLFNVFMSVSTDVQTYQRLATSVEFSKLDGHVINHVKLVRSEFSKY